MARRIVWSPTALKDVEELAEHIARDSETYARNVVQRLFEAVEGLTRFPRLGRRVPELGKENVREELIHQYRVIYRYDEHSITVAAVVHGARLLKNALRGRRI